MQPIARALLFDLDDTLIDNSSVPDALMQTCELVATTHGSIGAVPLRDASVAAWSECWPAAEHACWLGETDGFAVSLESWRRALASVGCVDEAVLQFAFTEHRRIGRDTTRTYSDATPLLAAAARDLGMKLAVVTNGPSDFQREKLAAAKIDGAFDAIVISAEVGFAKPSPEIFHEALALLDVDAADTWHVGDNLATDVAGADAAGVTAVWLNRNGTRDDGHRRPAVEITSLHELTQTWKG